MDTVVTLLVTFGVLGVIFYAWYEIDMFIDGVKEKKRNRK